MATMHPHINFNGNAEEAFLFYKSAFGGEFTKLIRFHELANPQFQIAEGDKNKILHIELPVGKANALMGNDVPSFMGRVNENEHRSKIVIRAESKAEADKLFDALSADGKIEAPIGESPWGSYFGMFRDRFGIEWMIEFASDPRE